MELKYYRRSRRVSSTKSDTCMPAARHEGLPHGFAKLAGTAVWKTQRPSPGFSFLELLIALSISLIMLAFAIPIVQRTMDHYRLKATIATTTWAIQATRYQSIRQGYPYQIALDPATLSYQVLSQPPGAPSFAKQGLPELLGPPGTVLSQPTTLQFRPGGLVQAKVGQLTFTISYKGESHVITVSTYGDISVSP